MIESLVSSEIDIDVSFIHPWSVFMANFGIFSVFLQVGGDRRSRLSAFVS